MTEGNSEFPIHLPLFPFTFVVPSQRKLFGSVRYLFFLSRARAHTHPLSLANNLIEMPLIFDLRASGEKVYETKI